MHKRLFVPLFIGALMLFTACGGGSDTPSGNPPVVNPPVVDPPFDSGPETPRPQPLGRGVNLGNMLEAPAEYPDPSNWGLAVQQNYLALIKGKGFDTVRIPIRWSAHAGTGSPYTIDTTFMNRIDEVVGWGLAQNLNILVNCHHWLPEDALFQDPAANRERYLAIWQQVATHFKDSPQTIYLELLNEPHGNLDAATWNALLADAVSTIRAIDTTHTLIIGGANWNSATSLSSLQIPAGESNIIATFHFYSPFTFTHQGAPWVSPVLPTGVAWPGSNAASACQAIQDELDVAAAWSQSHPGIPILLGEFGAYSAAEMRSRANWTAYVRKQAETRGFNWTYWEFCAGFGVYNKDSGSWNAPLAGALGLNPDFAFGMTK